ncbi:MAG: DUF4365 domain-containing protein [Alphaproteobacteria bacterium]|nr:DUF4365 domain-containing protein [Alphaproteobacteria bacterium]
MTDALLSPEDRKEALSFVYAQAIAAGAGYSATKPDIDRDSVDLHIRAGGDMRPGLDLQLKATGGLQAPKDSAFGFRLSIKNYNDLRLATQTPRLLVVLDLPGNEEKWMTVDPKKLILRRCAYWVNLHGLGETTNQTKITVQIPETNRFTVEALRGLMEQSRGGRIA